MNLTALDRLMAAYRLGGKYRIPELTRFVDVSPWSNN